MAFPQRFNPRRGQGRGQGRWQGTRGRTFPAAAATPQLPEPLPAQSKVEVIAQVVADESVDSQTLRITGTAYVASYNWTGGLNAEILIPGKPPKWQPPVESKPLKEDSGIYYRDPNAARFPSFPTEPAVRAVLHQRPGTDLLNVDIIGCGSTLGSLFSFVRQEDRTFRFGIEWIGKTLILVRKTNKPRETIEDVQGYGHTFAETYTTWESDVKGSASHQRIIQYTFGGLKFLVRAECDGYFPADSKALDNTAATTTPVSPDGTDLTDVSLSSLFVQAPGSRPPSSLNIRDAGSAIDQDITFDLKTRSILRKDMLSVSGFLQRLWVSQTPQLVLAFHKNGKFDPSDVQIHHVTQALKDWEVHNKEHLAQYHEILSRLIRLGRQHHRLEVRRIGAGPLEIWTAPKGWAALPLDLRALWQDMLSTELGVPEVMEPGTAEGGFDVMNFNGDGDRSIEDSGSEADEGDDAEYLRF